MVQTLRLHRRQQHRHWLTLSRTAPAHCCSAAVLILSGAIVLIVPVWNSYGQLQRGWDQRSCELPTEFDFDDQGLRISSATAKHEYRWAAFSTCQETMRLFYFRRGEITLCMIPKRGLDSEQIDALRRAVAEFIPGQSLGFPILPRR